MHAPASCDDEAEEGRDRGKGEAPPRLTHAVAVARAANTILPPRDFCVRRTRAHLAVGRSEGDTRQTRSATTLESVPR